MRKLSKIIYKIELLYQYIFDKFTFMLGCNYNNRLQLFFKLIMNRK